VVSPKKISDFKPLVTNLAQTSHYQVIFGGLSPNLIKYLNTRGVNSTFVSNEVGLLCSSASLPGSSLATADINGNFIGVMEKMAHTRIYTQLDLEFYVDSDYKTLKFIEHWMEYAAGGSPENTRSEGYYFRMRYPEQYKCNQTKIIKFDKDYARELEYSFIGMFPINLSSTPVSYDSSQILKVNASFNFERYIVGQSSSRSIIQNVDNNKGSDLTTLQKQAKSSSPPDYLSSTTDKLINEVGAATFDPTKLVRSTGANFRNPITPGIDINRGLS